MADAVIMDDSGGGRDDKDRGPAGPMGIRREEPIRGTQIRMDELVDPANLKHPIRNKQLFDVTVTLDGQIYLGPIRNPRTVIATGSNAHHVTFTVKNYGGDILVTSSEDLVKPKKHEYKTNQNAIITEVDVDGTLHPINTSGKVEITMTYQ
jgi:hypothetical protein